MSLTPPQNPLPLIVPTGGEPDEADAIRHGAHYERQAADGAACTHRRTYGRELRSERRRDARRRPPDDDTLKTEAQTTPKRSVTPTDAANETETGRPPQRPE